MLLSKFFHLVNTALCRSRVAPGLVPPRIPTTPMLRAPKRDIFGLVPQNQYENNHITKKFQLRHALIHHWEIIPLFLCVVFDIFVVVGSGVYISLINKVDVQYSGHNWNCISRNMDLCHPTIHKIHTFNQKYEPWPEMQAVLNKMTAAELRLQAQMDSCGNVGPPPHPKPQD